MIDVEEVKTVGGDRKVEVTMNDKSIVLGGAKQTGASIKKAAIEQGANIKEDFVLSIELSDGKTKLIGDDEYIEVYTGILPTVARAIKEIRCIFEGCSIKVEEDGSGGAFVVVTGIRLGPPYVQTEVWIGFQITFQYPYADVYPHFTNANLSRLNGAGLGEGFGEGSFRDRPAMQISRRSNRLNPQTDTAALKMLKVLEWMKSRP